MAATPLAYSSVLLLALTGVVIAVMVMGALELVPRTRWRNDHALRGQFLPPVGFAAGYECVVRAEGVRNPRGTPLRAMSWGFVALRVSLKIPVAGAVAVP
jgi:hypothetical protein